MKVGVPRESAAGERRVALVPGRRQAPSAPRASRSSSRPAPASRRSSPTRCTPTPGASDRRSVGRRRGGQGRRRRAPRRSAACSAAARSSASWPRAPSPRRCRRWRRPGVTAFAMEAIPRISRAQSMDALSSQANVGRLQGGAARRRALHALLPDADDRGGHDPAGQGARARRRRRRPAGAGHRARAWARRRPATTCAPRWPSRSSRWGPSGSTSGSRRPARAATRAS